MRLLVLLLLITLAAHSQPKSTPAGSVTKFYTWYIAKTKVLMGPGPHVVQGANGKSKLDTAGYFKELRALGVISEHFIRSEAKRLDGCARYMKTVSWKSFRAADAYVYEDQCPEMYFYYWIGSQETVDKVPVVKTTTTDSRAKVTVRVFASLVPVSLSLEHGVWKITAIEAVKAE